MALPGFCGAKVIPTEAVGPVFFAVTVLEGDALWLIVRGPEPVTSTNDTGPEIALTAGILNAYASLYLLTVGCESARNDLTLAPPRALLHSALALIILAGIDAGGTVLYISTVELLRVRTLLKPLRGSTLSRRGTLTGGGVATVPVTYAIKNAITPKIHCFIFYYFPVVECYFFLGSTGQKDR